MKVHSDTHHTYSVDGHCGDALSTVKSSVWNEDSPWQYIAMHIMYIVLTDTVIMSLTQLKSCLLNEGGPWQYIAIHTEYVERKL